MTATVVKSRRSKNTRKSVVTTTRSRRRVSKTLSSSATKRTSDFKLKGYVGNSFSLKRKLKNCKVVWQPIANSGQESAVSVTADEILLYGSRGGGKTIAQLMAWAKLCLQGWGKQWAGIILDQDYKRLDDIRLQGERFLCSLKGFRFHKSKADYFFEHEGGSICRLRQAKTTTEADSYRGHNLSFIGYNELQNWATPDVYLHMLGSNRASQDTVAIPENVFSTCNPGGAGERWIEEYFINAGPVGEVIETEKEIPDRENLGDLKTVKSKQVALFSAWWENDKLSDQYIAKLKKAVEENPALKEAWWFGRFGGSYLDSALGHLWDASVHVIDNFPIPESWRCDRAMDWGYVSPFSVGWFAESDGETFQHEGKTISIPRNSTVMFFEWYGTRRRTSNIGVRLNPVQIAEGVKERERNLRETRHCLADIYPGPADNQIGTSNYGESSIKDLMNAAGVRWLDSDKSKGSRVSGLQLIREALLKAKRGDTGGLYFMRRCRDAIDQLPRLRMEEKPGSEDIDSNQEDHIYDMLRYRLLRKPMRSPTIDMGFV